MNFAAIIQWISLGQQVFDRGTEAWAAIKGALAAQGIEADTSELDKVIADAQIRRAREEALAGTVPPVEG